jgi:hypothetical protein
MPRRRQSRSRSAQDSADSLLDEIVRDGARQIAGSKEGDRSSDVLGFPDASERIEVAEAIGTVFLSLAVSGPDGGWCDRVHSDAIGSQTGRQVDGGAPIPAFADE